MSRTTLAMMAALALGACGAGTGDAPDLLVLTRDEAGPDEFAIIPNRPLQAPPSFRELPPPTPGGANRTDQTPLADAARALGGDGRRFAGGVPAADGALVAHAARGGVAPGIRARLAAEDLEFRRDNDARLLERLFGVNIYYRAYASQALDQHAELDRWRRLGVRTPSAPPDPAAD
ncbi:MAG: DUF3035 domain-containing protein [Hasllibacter sp.]